MDAGADASSFADCFTSTGTLATYDLKLCDPAANECVFAAHQSDCCGNIVYTGIRKNQVALFQRCEAAWRVSLPQCGCPADLPTVEQSGTVANGSRVGVDCINCTLSTCVCITVPK